MDPVTAVTVATTAFNAIKAGFEHGREIETMISDIGRWTEASTAVKEAHKKQKKQKGAYGSIEAQALDTFLQEKQVQEQEEQLRALISWRYGPAGWTRIVEIQRDLRKQRQAELRAKEQRWDDIVMWVKISLLIGLCAVGVSILVALILSHS